MNHHQRPDLDAELVTLEHHRPPTPSTGDSLQRLTEDALCAGGEELLDVEHVVAVVGPLLAEKQHIIEQLAVNVEQARAEVEQLHKAWNLQRDKIRQLRGHWSRPEALTPAAGEVEQRFSGDLADTTIEDGSFAPPEPTEWRAGDPEPPGDHVQAVRGHRTHRIYFRETEAPGGRWIHRQSGDWCRWDYLIHFEGTAHLFNLGGGDG